MDTLEALGDLDIAGRCSRILSMVGAEICAQHAQAAAQEQLDATWLDPEDLAWAWAWNLAPLPGAGPNPLPKTLLTYTADPNGAPIGYKPPGAEAAWGPDTPFSEVWTYFTRSRVPGGFTPGTGPTTYLRELAWSVACERRRDWQRPETCKRPDSCDLAHLRAMHRHCDVAIERLRARYQPLPLDYEMAVNEAWSQIAEIHWVDAASERFLGLRTIRGMLFAYATARAIDQIRAMIRVNRLQRYCRGQGSEAPCSGQGDSRIQPTLRFGELADRERAKILLDDLSPGVLGNYLDRRGRIDALDRCLEELPPVRRLYAWLFHSVGYEGAEIVRIAREDAVKASGVYKELKKANAELVKCHNLIDVFKDIRDNER